MIILIILIAIFIFALITGGFNDLIERRRSINQARKGWKHKKELTFVSSYDNLVLSSFIIRFFMWGRFLSSLKGIYS